MQCRWDHPLAPNSTAPTPTQVVAAATRKKPGRVAGKQAGSTYYQNHLRNRQQRGGQFLGPPLLPEQQQQLLLDLGHTETSLPQQQQQEQHEEEQQQQQQQQDDPNPQPAPAVIDPASLRQLLQSCLAAATPQTPSQQQQQLRGQDIPQQQQEHQQQQQQQQEVLSRLEQQRQRSKQREPWLLPDHVSPELADSAVRLLKRRGGVVVEQPDMPSAEPLIPLPPLPPLSSSGSTSAINAGTSTTTSSSSSSSTGSAGPPPPQQRRVLLHVFWDLSSLHPGGHDPRVLVAQLRRVLGAYGEVTGVYAYGIQKLFNWVPEAFMLQYAPHRLPGRKRDQQQGVPRITLQTQQREVQQLLQQAQRAGVSLEDSIGPLRCRVCGKLRDNYKQLHAHMVQRHKQAAPPLEKLLPEGALAPMLAAAIAAAGGSSSSGAGPPARQQLSDSTSSTAGNPAAAAGREQPPPRGGFSWKVADPFAMRNSSTRTLGRVSRYFNSSGAQFIPPDSHQISLKYVLVREGVEVRTVQRQARAVSAAVADALHKALHCELLARSAEEVQEVQDVLVVVSDKATHAGVLREARKWGVQSVAVCGKMKRFEGADVTLRWQWVGAGRYDTVFDVDAA